MLNMLPCLPLLLLMGLSAGTVTADEGLALGAEAGSWITLTLEVPWGEAQADLRCKGWEIPSTASRRAVRTLLAMLSDSPLRGGSKPRPLAWQTSKGARVRGSHGM